MPKLKLGFKAESGNWLPCMPTLIEWPSNNSKEERYLHIWLFNERVINNHIGSTLTQTPGACNYNSQFQVASLRPEGGCLWYPIPLRDHISSVISVMVASLWFVVDALWLVCRWFLKVRQSIKMLLTCLANLNDTGRLLFISLNRESNCVIVCDL